MPQTGASTDMLALMCYSIPTQRLGGMWHMLSAITGRIAHSWVVSREGRYGAPTWCVSIP